MAVRDNGNSTEEDYLDSLLKSVLNETAGDKDEKQNMASDDELLDDIEADLFAASADIDSELSSEAVQNLTFGRDGEVHIKERPPKKEKKHHFWGRKKENTAEEAVSLAEKQKTDINEHSDADISEHYAGKMPAMTDSGPADAAMTDSGPADAEMTDSEPADAAMTDSGVADLGLTDSGLTDSEMADSGLPDISEPPEELADIFAGTEESGEPEDVSVDDSMKGLYDILGVADDESDESRAELEQLEEQKVSGKRRSRKERKAEKAAKGSKRGFFGRKKEPEAEAAEQYNISEQDSLSENLGQMSDGSGEQGADIGLEDLGGLFMGGEEGVPDEEKDENTILMEGMDNGEYDENDIMSDDDAPKKKEKKKKEKKEKKKKEKKIKEPKKKKERKPKEPKAPKEPDVIIPVSKAFLIFCVSFILLITIGVVLGGKYKNYTDRTDAAVAYYINKDYEAAYDELSGLSMHEDDQFFYDKLEIIMYVQRHYTSYKGLYKLEKYDKALHTLLRGVRMYDKHKEEAIELDCFDDFNTVLGWIDAALLDSYGITESQARELNLTDNRYVYAEKVYELADKAKAKEEAAKAEKEQAENGQAEKHTAE